MPNPLALRRVVLAGSDLKPPAGYVFVVDDDGAYLVDDDGAYIITEE